MRLFAILICILLSLPVFAQDAQNSVELEKRRQSILASIRETEEQLANIKKDKNATLSQLQALQNKLRQRQRLINNINQEIAQINNNIQTSAGEVNRLRGNLETLKLRYAQSVRYAYRSRSSYDMLAFLFSANDFNDALRRIRYLKKYREYRKEQADRIRITQGEIVKKIDVLNKQKSEKDVLLSTEEQQKNVLQSETNETNSVVKELKGKEKQLMAQIDKERKAAKKLENTIREVIRREIEIARKKAEEEERKKREEEARKAYNAANANKGPGGATATKPGSSGVVVKSEPPPTAIGPTRAEPAKPKAETPSYALSLTPEVAALSNNFELNRGKLPWPVEKGSLAEQFGMHPHALEEKVMMDNKGIEIHTSPNAAVRAVFDGEVTSVIYIAGMGQTVIVNHGKYFTVYARLANVRVKKGDKVKTKQPLGVATLNDDDVPMTHFELWKVSANNSSSAVDPMQWIAR